MIPLIVFIRFYEKIKIIVERIL